MKLTDNFNLSEFRCKCNNCDIPKDLISNIKELASSLQAIRDRFNAPVTINSAYRCPNHNKASGGVYNSQHILAKAADITIKGFNPDEVADEIECMLIDESLFPFHLGGIGRYNTFTHLDTRPNTARWDKRSNPL